MPLHHAVLPPRSNAKLAHQPVSPLKRHKCRAPAIHAERLPHCQRLSTESFRS